VDGGTNHWRMFLQKNSLDLKPPDVISGDFDSITEESAHFFDSVPKVMTPDQSETDFTKSIEVIKPIMDAMKVQFSFKNLKLDIFFLLSINTFIFHNH